MHASSADVSRVRTDDLLACEEVEGSEFWLTGSLGKKRNTTDTTTTRDSPAAANPGDKAFATVRQ